MRERPCEMGDGGETSWEVDCRRLCEEGDRVSRENV